jgi:uncharacterized iron-regulated membrane protein
MAVYSKILAVFLLLLLSCLAGIAVTAQQTRQGQESRSGKGKAVHEYSPEDVLPDAQEDENPRERKVQTGRPKQPNTKPVLSAARENPMPPAMSTVKSAENKATSQSPTVVSPPATAQTNSHTQDTERNRPHQKKLFISVSLFFLVLVTLFYFILKFIQERRVDYQAINSQTQIERPSEAMQESTESEAPTDLHVQSTSKVARGMKNKVRKVHNT